MNYYEVLVGSATFHGREALTYSSEAKLTAGQVVSVPLRRECKLGIIVRTVAKPDFAAKPIGAVYHVPKLPAQQLKLLAWLIQFYPAPLGMVTQLFLPKMLSEKLIENTPVISSQKHTLKDLPTLTSEQQNVLAKIGSQGSFLLHGETGSGKTRVYLELARQNLERGRSSIILTPEIGLTSQLIAFFRRHLASPVLLLHSQQTDAERRTIWLEILRAEQPLVIIGPRSALFAPVKNLGLIVLDEVHETSYKQEQTPHYHAARVASQLAELHKATLVMGSATPSVSDYFFASSKKVPILRMQHLARQDETIAASQPHLIDLKDHSLFTQSAHLSNPLLTAISQALERHEQILLFLNRRGTARIIACHNCGWQALCPNCDVPLTYHGDSHTARCHICGHQEPAPVNCPLCASPDITFKSIGTKAIADEVQRLFRHARVQRFDTDNKKSDSFNQQYEAVRAGDVDIIVGTQTLAKGLDLPRLSVVGVIVADTSLYLPDYTANERTYQLLYQVLGRVGRGHIAGQAFIQTYGPKNLTVQAAVERNWTSFYESELHERQTFLFPPFCFLLKLTCRRATAASAEKTSEKLADTLRRQNLRIQIIGPSPAFHEKLNGQYQWQLVIKSKQRGELLKVIASLPAGWSYDIDPTDLL